MPPAPQPPLAARILVGPTASGKSAIAQALAERAAPPLPVVSADAMTIYRGMDIGTAKPTPAERAAVPSFGFDLADPSRPFSVGAWLDALRRDLPAIAAAARGRPVIVAGGTGLYVKCLTEGLATDPPPTPALRARAQAILDSGGLPALRAAVRARDPAALDRIRDPENPRRLLRAYELLADGRPLPDTWHAPRPLLLGLDLPRPVLRARIAARARRMYAAGLLDEVRALRAAHPDLSPTARHAIGYAEAAAVLDGLLTETEAVERTIARTCQYAKRQMTWFRHQAAVRWLPLAGDESLPDLVALADRAFADLPPVPLPALAPPPS
jgi:tRNA dimethylallyltransferase